MKRRSFIKSILSLSMAAALPACRRPEPEFPFVIKRDGSVAPMADVDPNQTILGAGNKLLTPEEVTKEAHTVLLDNMSYGKRSRS